MIEDRQLKTEEREVRMGMTGSQICAAHSFRFTIIGNVATMATWRTVLVHMPMLD